MKKLNDQERKFAQELVKGCSIAEAARKAGYSDTTAEKIAARWLAIGDDRHKPHLAAYIEELRQQAEGESIADLIEIKKWLTTVLRTQMDAVMEFDGFGANPKPFDEMTPEQVSTIKKFKYRKGDGTELEMYSKMDAVEKLIKLTGGYAPEKREISGVVQVNPVDLSKLTDEQLDAFIKIKESLESE